MPKNRYDPLLFLPYSLSVASQGKTTPEPSGTRLSFETHRTGEFRNVPQRLKALAFTLFKPSAVITLAYPLKGWHTRV